MKRLLFGFAGMFALITSAIWSSCQRDPTARVYQPINGRVLVTAFSKDDDLPAWSATYVVGEHGLILVPVEATK